MEGLFIPGISRSDLEELIRKVVREEIKFALPPPTIHTRCDPEFITRRKAAGILSISLPTLHDWTLRGIFPSYRIGTRIRYKKQDILDALIKVEPPIDKNRQQ